MNWFLECLKNVKSILGMDSNSFYQMLFPYVIAGIISIFNRIKESKREKYLNYIVKVKGIIFIYG